MSAVIQAQLINLDSVHKEQLEIRVVAGRASIVLHRQDGISTVIALHKDGSYAFQGTPEHTAELRRKLHDQHCLDCPDRAD